MLFRFITSHALALIFWGFLVSAVGGIWMHFAA